MHPREGLGGVERRRAEFHAVRSERGLRGVRNRILRERMRQRLERGVVLEREVHSFVCFNENENANIIEREPARIGEAVRVALPAGERRQIVSFARHMQSELMNSTLIAERCLTARDIKLSLSREFTWVN